MESSPFWNPESTVLEFGIEYPESGIHSMESGIQDCPGFPYMGRSDKQAAVIYRRVTRSANGIAIMKKQHLSSFVAAQGTLVPCIFMCFSTNFQTSSCGFFACFCLFSFDEIACISSILRNELKRFVSGAVLSFAKKSLS